MRGQVFAGKRILCGCHTGMVDKNIITDIGNICNKGQKILFFRLTAYSPGAPFCFLHKKPYAELDSLLVLRILLKKSAWAIDLKRKSVYNYRAGISILHKIEKLKSAFIRNILILWK